MISTHNRIRSEDNARQDGEESRLREGDEIDTAALKALLRAAVDYNTTHSVPKSKGSRA